MKKNSKMMRYAAIVLVLVLATSCIVGNTFAKYTTSADSSDTARVAYWGFQSSNAIDITGLFTDTYNSGAVVSEDDSDVIAPGASGGTSFTFAYDDTNADAPEVAYAFSVDTDGSSCADAIQDNDNIRFLLSDSDTAPTDFADYTMTWEDLLAAIEALAGDDSGSKEYAPGELPAAFTADDDVHYIYWMWNFCEDDDADAADTAMGNAATLDEVEIVITVTATQIEALTPTT